ncbi:MAG: hypothetical protein Q8R47_01575 [Nanoarchaeota archaeon]|nr:hypothetical protein [Nanoarchaeota archaeon]
MADLTRLLKKAFIADKQGFREFGSEKKEEQQKKEPEIKDSRVQNFFSIKKEQPKPESRQSTNSPSRKFSLPSFNAPSLPKIPAATGVYIGLIILSIIGLILKSYVAYHPGGSLFLSIILGFFFFIAIHYTPEAKLKESLVFITFALDTFTQFVLGLFPESELKNWLITYHVFAWMILAVVLFLMGVFDTMGAGEHLGKGGVLIIILIIGFALFLLFPILITGPGAKQDETHAEYFHIAKTQVAKIGKTLEETKNVWHDYFACTFGVLGGSYKYDSCIDDKRIVRYCKNNFAATTEQQDCVKQQQEILKSGGKAGVAGSVSEAIKQVTKIELKEDQFFPKKATEPRMIYPIPLKVENPREQIFTVKASCEFKKGKEIVAGLVYIGGQEVSEVQINSKQQQFLIGCQPSSDLNGRYTLEYNVVLSGMQTFSFLKRAFISKEISAELRKQVEADNFKISKDKASQGPAEFALLNFKFGTGAGTEPLILVEEPTTFSFAVEDVGSGAFKGEVLKVNSYNFNGLWERGFSIDSERIGDKDCLQGGEIKLLAAQTKKREPSELKRCFLVLPPDLSLLQENEYKVETFVADFNYDYKITKLIPIEVTPLVASESVS